jgi:hypothetical protein
VYFDLVLNPTYSISVVSSSALAPLLVPTILIYSTGGFKCSGRS